MALRPNNGNYFVWDIDGGAVVGWLVRDGIRLQLVAGRIGGRLRPPAVEPTFPVTLLEDGRNLLRRDFVTWTKDMGAEYHIVEVAHVTPRRVSSAQSFSQEEVNNYYLEAARVGIQVLSPRFNTARHARADLGYPFKDDHRPKWFEEDTDAAILAQALMRRPDFDNWTALRPSFPDNVVARQERREFLTAIRGPVQDLVNLYRFKYETPPAWATQAFDIPWQVTRALAGILVVYPGMTWDMAKTAFELHGRTVSGRGRNSLVRSEVCHTGDKGPKADFVFNFGWAWIRHEFLRLKASMAGEPFNAPRPPARLRGDAARTAAFESKISLFEIGSLEPLSGSARPNEQGECTDERQLGTALQRQALTEVGAVSGDERQGRTAPRQHLTASPDAPSQGWRS